MSQVVQVPASLLQKMVGLIEKAGAYIEESETAHEQAKQAAPETVETLLKQGLIQPEQKQAALEKLASSHGSALETLRRTATHVKPASMGAPEAVELAKSAGDGSAISQADRNFLDAIGF